MRRFVVYDRHDNPLFDLDDRVVSATRSERLNGEHKLDIVTTQPLQEGMRILVRDGTLRWREWVVDEPDELHDGASEVLGTYGCTWSMQYDLATAYGDELWPGTYDPITARLALQMVLGNQSRWEVGNVTVGGTAGTSLYDDSVWNYLSKLIEVWGGEMEPRVEVDATGVVHRYVDWLAHVGSTDVTRRFDFGEDCTSIRRKVAPGPRYCRIIPRGGSDATDAEGIAYSERVGVEEEPRREDGDLLHPAGAIYVEDTAAATNFRQPDGAGGWHYPSKVVIYDSEDPEEILDLAMEDALSHTRPQASYEASVSQFVAAGMDPHGVQLGDEVHIVDRAFGEAPLRISARVVEMTVNELDDTDVSLVIGEAGAGLENLFDSILSGIEASGSRLRMIESGGTYEYLKRLIGRLNEEINATGGYTYITEGQGLRTYDREVSDPLVGAEATKVVEVKGGSIRIANSRTSGGEWDWKTVFVSGHVAAELVTAAQLTTGYIGNVSGSYWDLDNNEFRIASGASLGGTSVSQTHSNISSAQSTANAAATAAANAAKVATNYLTFSSSSGLDVGYSGTSAKTRINGSGMEVFDGDGVSEATFSGSSVRVGQASKAHVTINPGSGMEVFDGSGTSALFAGIESGTSIVRVGKAGSSPNVVMSGDGYVDVRWGSIVLAHFGYGTVVDERDQLVTDRYYSIGTRSISSGARIGRESYTIGDSCEASRADSMAFGYFSKSLGVNSVTLGNLCVASAQSAFAIGNSCTTDKVGAIAIGTGLKDVGQSAVCVGYYNAPFTGFNSYSFVVGAGSTDSSRKNALLVGGGETVINSVKTEINGSFYVSGQIARFGTDSIDCYVSIKGNVTVNGTIVHSSDKRLKDHVAYMGEDAADFVRRLRPTLFRFKSDGKLRSGFYAQDVSDADEWGANFVTEESDDGTLLLDYDALIAPLVAYAQQLERRIDQQQKTIDDLVSRIERLEALA